MGELLQTVRWKLVPFKELLNMNETMEIDEILADSRVELAKAIEQQQKTHIVAQLSRKRKRQTRDMQKWE